MTNINFPGSDKGKLSLPYSPPLKLAEIDQKQLLDSILTFRWNKEDSIWQMNSKRYYEWDVSQNISSYTFFRYKNDVISSASRKLTDYLKGGLILSEVDQTYDTAYNQWKNNTKKKSTYSTENLLISTNNQTWDSQSGLYRSTYRVAFIYDSVGNLMEDSSQIFDAKLNAWEYGIHNFYFYDSLGRKTEQYYKNWNYTIDNPVMAYRTTYQWDSAGNMLHSTSFSWDEDSSFWYPTVHNYFFYGEGGENLGNEFFHWDWKNKRWFPSYKSEITKDSSGCIVSQSIYYCNKDSSGWLPDSRTTSYYSHTGELNEVYEYEWDLETSNWTSIYRSTYLRYLSSDSIVSIWDVWNPDSAYWEAGLRSVEYYSSFISGEASIDDTSVYVGANFKMPVKINFDGTRFQLGKYSLELEYDENELEFSDLNVTESPFLGGTLRFETMKGGVRYFWEGDTVVSSCGNIIMPCFIALRGGAASIRLKHVILNDTSRCFVNNGEVRMINYGDVDFNDTVDARDARIVLNESVGINSNLVTDPYLWINNKFLSSDVDGDSLVTAYDASLILQFINGEILNFPVLDSASEPVSGSIEITFDSERLYFISQSELYSLNATTQDITCLNLPYFKECEGIFVMNNSGGVNRFAFASVGPFHFSDTLVIDSLSPQVCPAIQFDLYANQSHSIITLTGVGSIKIGDSMGFSVFPNPATDNICIQTQGHKDSELEIVNSLGVTVWKTRVSGSEKIFLSYCQLQKGMYLIIQKRKGEVLGIEKIILN